MLKSRACDAMTGAGGGFSEWSNESRGGNGLGRRGSGRLSVLGETGRNMNEGRRTTASGKSQAWLDEVAATAGSLAWTTWTSCRRARGTFI